LYLVYFTVTVTFAVLPLKVLTVMTAVPFFSALTFPFWSTLATLGLLDVQVRAEAVFFGSVAFSFSLLPFFSSTVPDLFSVTFFGAALTVTVALAVLPFFVLTVMTAVPGFFGVTTPRFDMAATAGLLDFQVRVV